MKTAVIILGHGSRGEAADSSIKRVTDRVKSMGTFDVVEHAFLQYTEPRFEAVLEKCIGKGAAVISIVPFFLQPGVHVLKDIPEMVRAARERHPDVQIRVADYVGAHRLMADIVLDLLEKQY